MNFQLLLGIVTLLTGIALVAIGTDYGRIVNITVGVIAGGVFIILGLNRIKQGWLQQKEE